MELIPKYGKKTGRHPHPTKCNGKLKPGAELPPERTFAEQMGVSRFSLREALRAAQVQGLIEIHQGKRPRVAEPTSNAAADVIALTFKKKEADTSGPYRSTDGY